MVELQMCSSTRRWPNPQKRQNLHPKATKEASTRCNSSCTPRRNEVHSSSKRSSLLARDQQWHQGNGKGLRDLQQASASTSQIANTATRTRLWEKLGTDLFEFNSSKYLMRVDYFSRFPVIRPLATWQRTSYAATSPKYCQSIGHHRISMEILVPST